MYNKRVCEKTNDKKLLHKIGKQWCTVSIAMLSLLGGGVIAGHAVHAASMPQQTVAKPATSAHNDNSQSTAGRIQQSASTLHANLMATAPVQTKPVQPVTDSQQDSQLNTKPTQLTKPKSQLAMSHDATTQAPAQNVKANQSTMPNNNQNNQGNINLRYRDVTVDTPIQFLDIHGKPYSNMTLPFGSNGNVQLDQNGVWHYQKNNVSVNETNGNANVPIISYDGADAQGHGLSNADGTYHGYWGFDVKGLRSDVNSTIEPFQKIDKYTHLNLNVNSQNQVKYQNNLKYLVMQSEPSYDKADFSYDAWGMQSENTDKVWKTHDITEGSVYQDVPKPSDTFNSLKMKDIDTQPDHDTYNSNMQDQGNKPVSHFFTFSDSNQPTYLPGHATLSQVYSDYYSIQPRQYHRTLPVYLEDITNKTPEEIRSGNDIKEGYISDGDAVYDAGGIGNSWNINDNDVQNDIHMNDGQKNPFNSKVDTLLSNGSLNYQVGVNTNYIINDSDDHTNRNNFTYNYFYVVPSYSNNVGWADAIDSTVYSDYQPVRIPVIEYYRHNPIPPKGTNIDIPSFWTYIHYWNPVYNKNYKSNDPISDYHLPYSSHPSDNSNPYLNDTNLSSDGKIAVTHKNGKTYYADNIATYYDYGNQDQQAPLNTVLEEHFGVPFNVSGYNSKGATYYVQYTGKTYPDGHTSVKPVILATNPDGSLKGNPEFNNHKQLQVGDTVIMSKGNNTKPLVVQYEGTASGNQENTSDVSDFDGLNQSWAHYKLGVDYNYGPLDVSPYFSDDTKGQIIPEGITSTSRPFQYERIMDATDPNHVHPVYQSDYDPLTVNSDLFLPQGTPIFKIAGTDNYMGFDGRSFFTEMSSMDQCVRDTYSQYVSNDGGYEPIGTSLASSQGISSVSDPHGEDIPDGELVYDPTDSQPDDSMSSLYGQHYLASQNLHLDYGMPAICYDGTHYLIYHNGTYYALYNQATGKYEVPVTFTPSQEANKLITPVMQTKHSHLYSSYRLPDINAYAIPQDVKLGFIKASDSDVNHDLVGKTKDISVYPTDKIIYDRKNKGFRVQSYHHIDDDLINHNNGDGFMTETQSDHTTSDDNPESNILFTKPQGWSYDSNAQYKYGGSWSQPGRAKQDEWRDTNINTHGNNGYTLVNVTNHRINANIDIFYFQLDTGHEFRNNSEKYQVPVSYLVGHSDDFNIYPFLPDAQKLTDGTYQLVPSEQKKFDGYKYLVSYTLPAGGVQPNTRQSAYVYLSKTDPNAQQEPLTVRYFDKSGHNLGHDINLNGQSFDTVDNILNKSNQKLWDYKANDDTELGIDFDNNTSAPYTNVPSDTDYQDVTNPILADDSYNNGRAMFGNHRYINIILSTPNKHTGNKVTETITRTIHYQNDKGQQVAPDKVQRVTYIRTPELDDHNNVISDGTWSTDNNIWSDVQSPMVNGYDKVSQPDVPRATVSANDKDQNITVVYSKKPATVTEAQTETVKHTVYYVDKRGQQIHKPQVFSDTFTRDNTVNAQTRQVVKYGNWSSQLQNSDGSTASISAFAVKIKGYMKPKAHKYTWTPNPNVSNSSNTFIYEPIDKIVYKLDNSDSDAPNYQQTISTMEQKNADSQLAQLDTYLKSLNGGFEFTTNNGSYYIAPSDPDTGDLGGDSNKPSRNKVNNVHDLISNLDDHLVHHAGKSFSEQIYVKQVGSIRAAFVIDKGNGHYQPVEPNMTSKKNTSDSSLHIVPGTDVISDTGHVGEASDIDGTSYSIDTILAPYIPKGFEFPKNSKGIYHKNIHDHIINKKQITFMDQDAKTDNTVEYLPKTQTILIEVVPKPQKPTNGKITVQYVDKATGKAVKIDSPVTEKQGTSFDIQPYTKAIPNGYDYSSTVNVPAKFISGSQTATVLITKQPVRSSITVQVIVDGQVKPYSTVTTTNDAGTPFKFDAQDYQMPKGYTIKSVTGQPSRYTDTDQTVTVTVVKPKPKTSTITVQYVDKTTGKIIKTAQPTTETVGSLFNTRPYISSIPQGYNYDSLKDTTDKFTEKDQTVTVLVDKKVAPKPVQPKKPDKPSIAMGTIMVDYIDSNSGRAIKSVTVSKPVGYQFNSHNYISELPQGYRYRRTTNDTTQFMPSAQTVDIYISKPVPKPNSSASKPAHSASAKPQSSAKAKPSSAAKPSSSMSKPASSSSAKSASSASSAKSSNVKKPSSSASAPSSSAKPSNTSSKARRPNSVPAKPASKATSQSASSSSSAKNSTSAKSASSQSVVPKSKAVPASSSNKSKSTSSSTQPSSSAKAPIKPSSASVTPSSSATPSSSSVIMPSSASSASSSASQPSEATSQSAVVPQPSSISVQPKNLAGSTMPVSERTASLSSAGMKSLSVNRVHDEHVFHSLEDNDKHLTKHNAVGHVRSELASATSQLNYDKHALSMAKSAQSAIDEVPTANHTSRYVKAGHTVNQSVSYGTFNKQKASSVRTARVPQVTKVHMNGHKATNNGHKKLPQTNEATSHMSIVAVFTATLGSFLAVIGKAFDRKHNK